MLKNKVLLVLNKLKTFSNVVDHEVNKFKSLIINQALEIRTKFVYSHIKKYLFNFVLVSNHFVSIHLDLSDRQHFMF